MSKTPLEQLEYNLRPISIWDRIVSLIYRAPANSRYCDIYDQWLNERLDSIISVEKCEEHELVLSTKKGHVSIWVSNYPYHYGGPSIGMHQKFISRTPSWRTIIKIREIQLSHRDKVIRHYKEDLMSET